MNDTNYLATDTLSPKQPKRQPQGPSATGGGGHRVGSSRIEVPTPDLRRPFAMSYKHINSLERALLQQMLSAGHSFRMIARTIGRSASTISRELMRNQSDTTAGYQSAVADDLARNRLSIVRRSDKMSSARLRSTLIQQLEKRWSPQIISHRLVLDHPNDPEMRISHESIYHWLYTAQPHSQPRGY